MRRSKTGPYVRFKDVVSLLSDIETHQQGNNCNPSCPCCGGYAHMGGHEVGCELGLLLKEAKQNQMPVMTAAFDDGEGV
jgi:hypothetical protein